MLQTFLRYTTLVIAPSLPSLKSESDLDKRTQGHEVGCTMRRIAARTSRANILLHCARCRCHQLLHITNEEVC
jgi:hypothetical protein